MLKQLRRKAFGLVIIQPPSGGCVLKPSLQVKITLDLFPAAFRRLCVETSFVSAGSRLWRPAAFRRLCVETTKIIQVTTTCATSRLQAAVC